MSRRLLLALLALAAASSACDRPRPALESVGRHTFPARAGKLVQIDARSLDTSITVAPGDEIAVALRLAPHVSSTAQQKRWLERHQPVFEDSPERLRVTVPSRLPSFSVGWSAPSGTLSVTVPPICQLEVNTTSGDVSLDGSPALAEVRIDTQSGDLTVHGGVARLLVESVSGDVTVLGPPLALLDVRTTSGDVLLRAGCERTLVESISGDFRLLGLTGGLSSTTTSGDLQASFTTLAPGEAITVTSVSGNVTLSLPEVPLSGQVQTVSGRIRSRFEGNWQRRHRTLLLPARPGAVQLAIATTSGDVVLSHRP